MLLNEWTREKHNRSVTTAVSGAVRRSHADNVLAGGHQEDLVHNGAITVSSTRHTAIFRQGERTASYIDISRGIIYNSV